MCMNVIKSIFSDFIFISCGFTWGELTLLGFAIAYFWSCQFLIGCWLILFAWFCMPLLLTRCRYLLMNTSGNTYYRWCRCCWCFRDITYSCCWLLVVISFETWSRSIQIRKLGTSQKSTVVYFFKFFLF